MNPITPVTPSPISSNIRLYHSTPGVPPVVVLQNKGDAEPSVAISSTPGVPPDCSIGAALTEPQNNKQKRAYHSARSVYRPFDFEQFLLKKGLCREAEEYLRAAESQRSRHPNGYRSNTLHVPCEKFGCVVIGESRGFEYPAILTALINPDVARLFDQPPRVIVRGQTSEGSFTIKTVPDMVAIMTDGSIEVWEVKPAAKLAALSLDHPNRYQCVDGVYRSAVLERHFSNWGFSFRVITEHNFEPRMVAAARFLMRYMTGVPETPILADEYDEFVAAVAKSPGLRLAELPIQPATRRAELFYYFVARGEVFTNLSDGDITCPDTMRIFPTARDESAFALFRSGHRKLNTLSDTGYHLAGGSIVEVNHREYEIVHATKTTVRLRTEDGQVTDMSIQALVDMEADVGGRYRAEKTFEALFQEASIEDRAAYYHRRKAIAPYISNGLTRSPSPKARTVRTWLKLYHDRGDVGLIPKHHLCGNREMRLADDVASALKNLLERQYRQSGKKESIYWIYLQLVAMKDRGEISGKVPSPRTVYRHCHSFDKHETMLRRAGKRAAMINAPIHVLNAIIGSPHGQRDFQVAHIDSTIEDIAVDHPESDKRILKRYIAMMVDSFNGEILAYHRTEEPTSGAAIRGLLLDCFARHSSLPAVIVCDWGSEHDTVWLKTVTARLGVTLHLRPKATPRAGSHVESGFAALVKQLYHNLSGTTALLKNARMVTRAVDPKNFTCWSDRELADLVEEYVHLRNNLERRGKPSPVSIAFACQQKFGPRPLISYDKDEIRWTLMPFVEGRTRRVSPRGTIRIGNRTFSNDKIRPFAGKDLLVRQDPDIPDLVYVNPPNRQRMIDCRSVNYGGPSAEIIEEAEILDHEKLGESTVPGASASTVIRANFVARTEEKQTAMKKKRQPKSAKPVTAIAPKFGDLPKLQIVRRTSSL